MALGRGGGPLAGSGVRLTRRCQANHRAALAGLSAAQLDRELTWVWTVQESCVKRRTRRTPLGPGHRSRRRGNARRLKLATDDRHTADSVQLPHRLMMRHRFDR